jgi:hypothetical protein
MLKDSDEYPAAITGIGGHLGNRATSQPNLRSLSEIAEHHCVVDADLILRSRSVSLHHDNFPRIELQPAPVAAGP